MSKRTVFTTITPLPSGISREVALALLHNHLEMIDLNPLVKERHPIKPPAHASPEEFHCIWYSLTDKISYLPGGLVTGDVSYTCAFHDLPNGLQTHCYAPMGLDIRDKWTLGGSLPGEPVQPVELGIGAPITGLYIREDVDMKCNVFMTSFVKKNLKKAHAVLVDRMKVKGQIASAANLNHSMSIRHSANSAASGSAGSPELRPGSTASGGSSSFQSPPPRSPDPSVTTFGPHPGSPPPANHQGSQFSPPPPGFAQPSVSWQSLKPSPSVASNTTHTRTASFGSSHTGQEQWQQQPQWGNPPQGQQQYPHWAPQAQYGQQHQQWGPPGPYGQQLPPGQWDYLQQQNQQQGPVELGGPHYPNAPAEGGMHAPPLPTKGGATPQPLRNGYQKYPQQPQHGGFIAELE